MRESKKIGFVVMGVLLILTFATAQIKYGSIIGKITDSKGEALPGCTVVITSPSMIDVSKSAVTNDRGFYRFVSLAPGFYTLTAELQGFKKLEQQEIRVMVGETVTLNIVMEQGVLEQTVTVLATPPAVDIKKSEISIDFTKEMLRSLPMRAHDMGTVNLAPGVHDSSAQGSSSYSNQYQLDGQNITDQWHGNLKAEVPFDFVEETEVTTAGGKAEYGEYTGAVVNAITKGGSNRLSGEANFYFYNDKLVNYRQNELSSPSTHYDTSLFLGGPIKENRLWFFVGGSYLRDVRKSLDFPNGAAGIVAQPFVYSKFNYLINSKNKGFVSYQYDRKRTDAGIDIYTAPSALYHLIYFEHLVNFQHQIVFNPNTFMEAKFNYKTYKGDQIPNNPTLEAFYDLGNNYWSGGMGCPNGDDTWRARLMLDLTHFKDNWILGSHEFKLGFVYDRSKGTNYYAWVNNRFNMPYLGQPYLYYTADHNEIVPEGMQEYNAYAQDSVAISPRFTVDLGLRWSYSSSRVLDVTTPQGITQKGRGQMFSWNNLSPRIGLAYALTSDLKTLFKASYGRYYNFNTWFSFYGYGPYSMTMSLWYVLPNGESTLLSVSGPATNQNIDPNLKRPYVDTFTLGIQREVLRDFTVEINYIHKEFRDMQGDVNTAGTYESTTAVDPVTGKVFTVYNQTNPGDNFYLKTSPSGLNYHYNGFDFILNKRFSKNWFMQGSFHWEKCKGLANEDRFGGIVYKDPNNEINAVGTTLGSREYQVKLLASYFIEPLGVRAAAIYNYVQGPHYSRQFSTVLNQGPVNIYAVPRASLVSDPVQQLDLRLEKTINIRGASVGVLLDVHNVFNGNKPTGIYDILDIQPMQVSAFQDPRFYQLGIRLMF